MTTNAASVRFGRLERRGLLLGLSGAQLGLVGMALIVVVAAGLAAGPPGVLVSAPVWAVAGAWAVIPVGGRPAVEVTPTASAWLLRRITGTAAALASPWTAPDSERLDIPGVPGRLRLDSDERTGAALVRSGRAGCSRATVIAEVRGRGFLLADAGAQDRLVTGWGRLLASLAHIPGVCGVQVHHRCAPSSGRDLHRWWAGQAGADAPWARAVVSELAADVPNATGVRSLLAVSLRLDKGKDTDAVLGSLTEAITTAELDVDGWLTPAQVRRTVRESFDSAATAVETSATPGPMGVAESWDHLRTERASHAVYWISEWPRSATHPSFLRPLLLAPGARRTLSVLATPSAPGKALREIRRARAEQTADAMTRARIGRVEDEVTRAAAAELDRREEDLVAGHGDLKFIGLLVVSAPSTGELAQECAAAETAAAQAGCELRRLVGQQVQAFAAGALPLARVLP